MILLLGCMNVDSFVHNPVHCSTVGADTCPSAWHPLDDVCVPCDEEYDWGFDHPWLDGTFEEGAEPRDIDASTVLRDTIRTEDDLADLDLYFVPAWTGSTTTVLYNHGNYAGIEHYLPRVRFLHEAGYNVLVWDYRGYGKSTQGAPTAEQFLADARQIRAISDGYVPDPDRVVIYANSLGGIPAVEMAVDDPGCALMLEASFTSTELIAQSNTTLSLGEQFLSEGRFDNVEKIRGYDGPVFGMVGGEDEKFPPEDFRQLIEAAPGPTELWILDGVKHGMSNGGVPEAGLAEYFERMDAFLVEHAPECL